MPTNPITIFEMVENGGFNSLAVDNTAFYCSNLQIANNGQLTVGFVTINSTAVAIGGSPLGGGLGGTSEYPLVDNVYVIGNTQFRWANSFIDKITSNTLITNTLSVAGLTTNSSGFSGTANNALYLGGVLASSYALNSALSNYATINNPVFTGVTNTAALNVGGDLNISGNLYIDGTTTFINATAITTADKTITLANTATSGALADGSGIYIATIAKLLYNNATNSWQSNVAITPTANNINLGNTSLLWNLFANQISGTLTTTSQPNITANSSNYLGATAAAGYQTTAGLSSNVAGLTANNATNLGGTLASGYQTTSGLSSNVTTLTANNTLYVGTVSAANVVSNTQLSSNLSSYQTTSGLATAINTLNPTFTTSIEVGTIANNVTINTTAINIGNSLTNSTINSTSFSGNANNTTYFAGQSQGYYANVTSPNFNTTIEVGGAATNNVTVNTTTLLIGNSLVFSTVNSTIFSQTANNASYLGSVAAANYANTTNTSATNITTGTLPYAQLGAAVVNTSGNFTLAGNITFNANLIVGGKISANGSVGGAAQVLTSGGGSANAYWSTSGGVGGPYGSTTQIAYNNAGTESGDANLLWYTANGTLSVANGFLLGANNYVNTSTYFTGNTTTSITSNSSVLSVGNTGTNTQINATSFSGTSNNALYLGTVIAASYANTTNTSATNITTGTLPWAQAPSGTANLSAVQTFTGNTTFSANVLVSGVQLEVGAAANNVTVNTTTLLIGNATIFSTVNSTIFSQTANNATNLGGTLASSFANTTNTSATNITTGTLPWTQAPSGTVNTSGNFTLAGNITHSANIILQSGLSANASFGAGGQVLASNGTTGSPYWITLPGSGPIGTTTQIAFNKAGVESGDANLTWTSTTSALAVNGSISTNTITITSTLTANGGVGSAGQVLSSNGTTGSPYWVSSGASAPIGSTTQIAYNKAGTESGDANLVWLTANGTLVVANGIIVGLAGTNTSINTTSYSGTSNNSLYLGGTIASSFANTTNTSATNITTGTLPWAQAPSGTANLSAVQTFAGNTTFSANVLVSGVQLEVGAAANNVTVNTTTLLIGNATIFSTVNSTVFSQTANNATNLGGTLASGYQTTAGLSTNVATLTANNANYLGTVIAASYANTTNTSATNITTGTLPWAQAPAGTVNTSGNFTLAGNITHSANLTFNTGTNQLVLQGGLGAGGNVIVNSTAIYIGNATSNNLVNSTSYSGTANNSLYLGGTIASSFANTTNTSATNITTGTLPYAQLGASVVNTSGNFTLAGNTTFSANVLVSGVQLEVGAAANNVTVNTTTLLIGNATIFSTVNSTVFSQTANNATNLGGTLASGYQTTAGLSANVATLNANNASYLGTVIAASYANTTNTSATNITTGTLPWAQAPTGTVNTSGNFTLAGNTTFSANVLISGLQLEVGAAANNVTVNTTTLLIGNATIFSTVNSTVFSQTANNANYLSTVIAASYANTTNTSATNITTGTLPWAQAPTGTVNTSGNFTLAGNTTFSANVILQSALSANSSFGTPGQSLLSNGTTGSPYWGTGAAASAPGTNTQITYNNSGVSSGAANLTWNLLTSTLTLGTTTNTTINTTAFSGTANNTLYLGGTLASSFANTTNTSATNITTGTLPWTQAPSGTVNTSGNFTLAGNTTFSANVILNASLSANGGIGTGGQVLTSNGTTGSPYWSTISSGAVGSTTQIAYNKAGVESGDANLIWNTANGTIAISNGFILGAVANNVTVNTTTIQIGNATIFSTVNSTIFSQTANNATNLGGVVAASYANTTNTSATNITTGTLPWAQAPSGTANLSAVQTFAGNTTFSANVLVSGVQLEVGAAANNVTVNTTTIQIGNATIFSTVNSTVFSQTANNATNLGGTLASGYQTTAGLSTNVATLTANNANYLGTVIAASYANTTNTSATNITTGTLPYAQLGAAVVNTSGNFTLAGNITYSANLTFNTGTNQLVLQGGLGAGGNVIVNSTAIYIGNSSTNNFVNSTSYSGVANNATNLGGVVAASYANTTNTSATNITTGTLPWAQAPTGTVNTSGNFTLAGNTTFSANVLVSGVQLEVGAAANNVTVNTTTIQIGNATIFSTVNSTIFSQTANNATNLGGTVAANYANTTNTSATNITTGTLPWAQAPTGTVNTSANFTIAGVHTHSANVVLQSSLSANGGFGTSGQVLTSNGTTGSPYWSTSAGGATGANTQIAFNNSGTEAGDANLTWNVLTSTLSTANLIITAGLKANGGFGTSGQSLLSNGTTGSPYWGTGAAAGAAGANTQIMYNNSGVMAGDANLTWNNSTVLLTLGSTTVNTAINSSTITVGNSSASGYLSLGANVIIQNDTLSIGNATVNTVINSTALDLPGLLYANNNTTGTAGQALLSGGASANIYWGTIGGGGPIGSTTQIAYNNAGTESGDANLLWYTANGTLSVANGILLGANNYVNTSAYFTGNTTTAITSNSSVLSVGNTGTNTQINATSFSGTSNNALYLGGTLASSFANTTNTSATNITTGTLPYAQLGAAVVNTSGNFTLAGNITHSANLTFNTGTNQLVLQGGLGAGGNVIVNSTAIYIGNATSNNLVNSTSYSGTANNALYLGSTIASFFANTTNTSATNITTGTLPWAQAPSGTVNTSGNFTLAGNITHSANLTFNTGTNQLILQGGLGAGGNVIINSTAIYIGNATSNNLVNSTSYSGTANNALYLGGTIASSFANTTNTSATNITTGTLPWAQAPAGTANLSTVQTFAGNTTFSANLTVSGLQLEIGAAANNVTVNTTTILLGNATIFSTVNSTIFSQTANNANYLGTVIAASYANTTNTSATNITTGTLPYAQLGAAVVNTSGNFTLAGNITHSANLTFNTGTNQLVLQGGLGAGGNVIINSTAIYIGNSSGNTQINSSSLTVNSSTSPYLSLGANIVIQNDTLSIGNATVNTVINSTALYLPGLLLANNAAKGTAGQALLSGGASANIYWGTVAGGATGANTQIAFNNSGTEAGDANLTWNVLTSTLSTANLILTAGLKANGGFGTGGQVLGSNGTTGSPYWFTLPGSGPVGSTTQIAYNNAGTESGDANLLWYTANGTLSVANGFLLGANNYVNTSSHYIGNTSTYNISNSSINILLDVNGNTTINSTAISVGNTSTAGLITVGNNSVNTQITSTSITLKANTGLSLGTSSIAANGYCWLPNGLMMNWGISTVVNSATLAVTFANTFPVACFCVTCSSNTAKTTGGAVCTTFSTTGCTLSTANTTNETVSYIALGH